MFQVLFYLHKVKESLSVKQVTELSTEKGKTIKISLKSYEWLAKQSKGYGDSMENIIQRLIQEVEGCRKEKTSRKYEPRG